MKRGNDISKNWALSPHQYVNLMYHILLGREPDPAGLQSHVDDLERSGDPTQTFRNFLGSAECRRYMTFSRQSSDWTNEIAPRDLSGDFHFNDMLHEQRTGELKRTDGTSGTMLSIGCSNETYFDWIHQNMGKPGVHIGLEYYSPKPGNLPANVRWIANTAGNMADIQSDSVDLIFGGQVVEHLWADELTDFLLECCRVLKDGGRLIFDTPNEKVTRNHGWNHAEHTLEFRPDDARRLLTSLGFEVTKVAGHWLCEDDTGFLRINRIGNDASPSKDERIRLAGDRPEASFNWWIEARYHRGVTPERETVKAIVKDMWMRYGHHIFNRTIVTESAVVFQRGYGRYNRFTTAQEGWSGSLLRASGRALPPGQMRLGVELDAYQLPHSPGYLEVTHPPSGQVLGRRELPAVFEGGVFVVESTQPQTFFDGQFSLVVNGTGKLTARMAFLVDATVYKNELWHMPPGED